MRNGKELTLRLSNTSLSGSDHVLLTQRQINKIEKAKAKGVGCEIDFSATQMKHHRAKNVDGGAIDPSLILEGIKAGSDGVANIFGSVSSTIQNQKNRENEKQYLTGEVDAHKAKMNMMSQTLKTGMQMQRFEALKKFRDQNHLNWSDDQIFERVLNGGAIDPQLAGDAIRSSSNAGANVVGNITGLIDNSLEQGFVKKKNDGTYDFMKQFNDSKKNAYNDSALMLKIAGIKGMVKKFGLNWSDDKILDYAMKGGTVKGLGLYLQGKGMFLQGEHGKGMFVQGGCNCQGQGLGDGKPMCRALTPQCTGLSKEEFAKKYGRGVKGKKKA